jgi:F-type H+-transporting ATPase subunit b
MSRTNHRLIVLGCTVTGILCLYLFLPPDVLAEEKSGNWRHTYDLVMMWLNFGILAFIMVKFGKAPLMNFLRGQKDTIAREIEQLEEEKKKILAKVHETYKGLEESESRFSEIKSRIIEQGEKRKNEIIKEAKQQSQIIVDIAKQKAEGQIKREREKFKAELIDSAIELAMKQLPEEVTEEDHQKLIESYLVHV